MGRAKEILIKVIASKPANDFIKKHHYSGKVVIGGCGVHFGCFLNDRLHGVMSFGSPLDKRKVLPLVSGASWNQMLELNRLAFDETLPKNSESRCLSIAIRLLKKNAPQIKWILSYADGCQCGDGTIYRASGFLLTAIKRNNQLIEMENGEIVHKHSLNEVNFKGEGGDKNFKASKLLQLTNGSYSTKKYFEAIGQTYKPLEGYQLRYIYLIDKTCKITVPILPFSKIDEMGAGMYKGEKRILCRDVVNASTNPISEVAG